jgi:septum formation protein
MGRIVLASQSPRRRELLEQMGIVDFDVMPAYGGEEMNAPLRPRELVEQLAYAKAREVSALTEPSALVIAADTVVVLEGQVLGKPKNRQQAVEMLTALSGKTHQVYTGVVLMRGERVSVGSECTDVTFRRLEPWEIQGYADTGESMDKAGAYGIQGRGALLVSGIRGDYFNVVGLPVCRLGQMLRQFGIETLFSTES